MCRFVKKAILTKYGITTTGLLYWGIAVVGAAHGLVITQGDRCVVSSFGFKFVCVVSGRVGNGQTENENRSNVDSTQPSTNSYRSNQAQAQNNE